VFILELEERLDCLLEQTVQRNPFWGGMRKNPRRVPVPVFWGTCLENFHILAREPLFDGPVLSFSGNRLVREALNQFYAQELGHDQLLLKALTSIGLAADDVRASIPLASTSAFIDALAFWARFDPLFFVATLGVLEGREVAVDAFVLACKARELPREFFGPIEAHARVNAEGRHGELTRRIFANIDVVNDTDRRRIHELLPLFVATYDGFYRGIWEHYGTLAEESISVGTFLRRLPEAK
jgi:hypothetical protein